MNIILPISIVASGVVGFIVGALWQRARTRNAIMDVSGQLKTSNDALEQAVQKNQQTKGK